MGLFEFHEGDSLLHRRHPIIKLAALWIIALVVTPDLKPGTPWLDPGVPLVFLSGVVVGLSVFGRIPLTAILGRLLGSGLLMLPVLLLGAIFFDATQVASPTTLVDFGPWSLTREGVLNGLGLVLRVLTYLACAMALVMTTDPAAFAISLMQQARVSYRFGYALLARSRFLALRRGELDIIRAAHRLRGTDEPRGLLQCWQRYSVPLLTAANRHARRAAIARDSRGFEDRPERTVYRQMPVTAFDWSFLMAVIGVTLVLIEVLILAGMVGGSAPGTGT